MSRVDMDDLVGSLLSAEKEDEKKAVFEGIEEKMYSLIWKNRV